MSVTIGRQLPSLPVLSVPLAVIGGLAIRFGAPLEPAGATMLAITAFCIVLWIGNLVPPAYTGILCLGIVGIAFSMDLALVGFQSPATWLIAFGLVMGEATRRSGLAEWTNQWIVDRCMPVSPAANPHQTYRRLLVGLSIGAFLLTLIVPVAIVRVLVLAPILLEAGERFDSKRAGLGLFLGPLFVTHYGTAAVLTGGSPNIVVVGILESITGVTITWTEWFALMFPVMGVGRLLVIVAVASLLYRPEPDLQISNVENEVRAMTGTERRMLVFLLAGVAVWASDFLHGLHPVYGALFVVVLSFLPGIGVVEFEGTLEDVDFSILFFIAAVFAIGDGLARTGVADRLAEGLLTIVPENAPLVVVLGIVLLIMIGLMFVVEELAAASVVTPIFVSFATDAGIPVTPIVLTEAMAFGLHVFPYQSAVLVVMLAYSIAEPRELIRMAAACTLAIVLLLVPIQLAIFGWIF
ncbi:SLC13 family permease [Natrarchaeobius oligotrophus]|uniref:Sodium:sulfate symporter n=1 Tax=Natrarchaeobius chitinivorans TaxID=1679083 RepID=A0A3N6NRF1_NATCH|nr:SLC13 family permease [Natrarchaeobius chitinivorans]RQH02613.1 sodium:sulfate symporter [Natrarchaeobius chitinivorans]